jgi:hypothetical protein
MIFSEFPAEPHFHLATCRVAVTPSGSPVRTSQPSLPHPVVLSEVRRSRTESKDPIAVWAELNLESISSMDHQYGTYIVASLSGTLYIGMTNNIERRILNQRNFLRPSPPFELPLSRNGIEDLVKPWTAGETPALQSRANPSKIPFLY